MSILDRLFRLTDIPAKSREPLGSATIAGASNGYVSVHWTTAEVRYHPSGKGYGSPYSFSCNVTRIGNWGWLSMGNIPDELRRAGVRFTPDLFREIKRTLKGLGVDECEFQRNDDDGKVRFRRVS